MKIIIIDDDPLVVSSLKTIVEAHSIEVLALGHSGIDAINLYKQYKPDVVLMDIRMENLSGIKATEEILKYDKDAKILLITTFRDDEYIKRALELGCSGYILKQHIDSLIPSIEAVDKGNMVFDSEIVGSFKTDSRRDIEEKFSSREMDILILLAEGLNNKEIAGRLFLSEGTIRNYISIMLDKLELRDRTQLAIYYYRGR